MKKFLLIIIFGIVLYSCGGPDGAFADEDQIRKDECKFVVFLEAYIQEQKKINELEYTEEDQNMALIGLLLACVKGAAEKAGEHFEPPSAGN